MLKEIGSNFWLSPEEIGRSDKRLNPNQFGCGGNDFVWTSTGRSAIDMALLAIGEKGSHTIKRALLPAYTCHTVVVPFTKAGYQVQTYPTDNRLRTDEETIFNLIEEFRPSVILFHDYFGFKTFPFTPKIEGVIKEIGAYVIEDCTHNLYGEWPKSEADFYVSSIRKWCGVPDGGFVVRKSGHFALGNSSYDALLEQYKVRAAQLKYEYMILNSGKKETFLEAYSEAERVLNRQDKIYTISPISVWVQSLMNVELMKKRRRNNYSYLLTGLSSYAGIQAIFTEFPEGVVPLYFPVICRERAKVQKLLATHNIYAPIIWSKPESYAEVSLNIDTEYLYEHLLCIPIDQRYNEFDMNKILEVLSYEQ